MSKKEYSGLDIEVYMFDNPDVVTASGEYTSENDETEKM